MNPKGDLIARLLASGLGTPSFEAASSGPAHERVFRVTVLVAGRALGPGGEGRSKKEAERAAAEAALNALDTGPDEAAEEAEGTEGGPDEYREPQRWPIYAGVLSSALEAALELTPDDATTGEVAREAARLYRALLAELGHGPEMG